MDFSADGMYLIASCEFGMTVIKVDIAQQQFLGDWHWGHTECRRT